MEKTIVWFRKDLRISDNPALEAAVSRGGSVIPLFIWSPEDELPWSPGAASRWWLNHSLTALQQSLSELGSRLIIRSGSAEHVLLEFVRQTGASSVFWNRRYEPVICARDERIKSKLAESVGEVRSFNSSLLFEPWENLNKQNKPYQVYTPFSKQYFSELVLPAEPETPRAIAAPKSWPASDSIASLALLPKLNWDKRFYAAWQPGEDAALKKLEHLKNKIATQYDVARDLPGISGTSRLSPHLHFGEIGPRQIWRSLFAETGMRKGTETYLKEIVWREFAYHLLFHFPKTPSQPLRGSFAKFPWRKNTKLLKAWHAGKTGYPIVDAGMRELWATGWMHNRVRMIVASFLVKHMLVSWRDGADWFWDTLVDADLASNTLGWQWTAGCGADAAPFFRIFNPILQGERFDTKGDYVRQWVPELSKLNKKWIHKPWEAPPLELAASGIKLGVNYPRPIVEHSEAREKALEAFEALER